MTKFKLEGLHFCTLMFCAQTLYINIVTETFL